MRRRGIKQYQSKLECWKEEKKGKKKKGNKLKGQLKLRDYRETKTHAFR